MRVALVSVPVNDPVQAFKFYTEVLGFAGHTYIPEARLAVVVSPTDRDGTALLLEPNDSPVLRAYQEGVYQLGLPIIVLGVDDIYREYERLKGLGVAFTQEPARTDYGTQAVLDDTCGNLVQLHQAP